MLSNQKTLSNELKDGQKIKTEIATDIQRLQRQVEGAVNERQAMQEELDEMEKALNAKTAEAQNLRGKQFEMKQNVSKFLIQCFNVLLNIRHKYENTELISKQIDLSLKNQFHQPISEEEDEQLVHQQICILELANLIGNITNVLNFELKNVALKEAQIVELQDQVSNAKQMCQTIIK